MTDHGAALLMPVADMPHKKYLNDKSFTGNFYKFINTAKAKISVDFICEQIDHL
jgi:hypothetical protein